MKNSDMPVTPIIDNEQSFPIDGERYGKSLSSGRFAVGMTKREEFALKIMAGIYSNPAMIDDLSESSAKVVASAAAKAADALLEELERTK